MIWFYGGNIEKKEKWFVLLLNLITINCHISSNHIVKKKIFISKWGFFSENHTQIWWLIGDVWTSLSLHSAAAVYCWGGQKTPWSSSTVSSSLWLLGIRESPSSLELSTSSHHQAVGMTICRSWTICNYKLIYPVSELS